MWLHINHEILLLEIYLLEIIRDEDKILYTCIKKWKSEINENCGKTTLLMLKIMFLKDFFLRQGLII
jgi:hypothetical protein